MSTTSVLGRMRRIDTPAWARRANGDGASLSPARAREAIRQHGHQHGWRSHGVWGSFLNSLCGETAQMRRKYPEMFFREGSIKSPLLSAVWSVASLDLQVLPADKKSQRDRDIADAYRYALLHADGGIPQTVTEILLPARIRGESLCHLSLRERLEDRGRYKGKRLIHAVKAKPPGSFRLKFDDYGNLVEIGEGASETTYTGSQLDEFIHYRWLSLEGSDGVSDLRAAVGAFETKDAIWKLRTFFLDKMAGGFLAATGVTEKNRAAMAAALAEARSCGFITVEPGADVKVLELAQGTDAEFKSALEDCDREMMIAVGAAHLPFSEGQGGEPRGDTTVQRQVSSQTEWKMAADLGFILSRKAKLFVDENYAGADYPEVQLGGGVDPSVVKAQLDVALAVAAAKPISGEYLHELTSVPPPKDEADAVTTKTAPPDPNAGGGFPFAESAERPGEAWVWEEDVAGTEVGSHG